MNDLWYRVRSNLWAQAPKENKKYLNSSISLASHYFNGLKNYASSTFTSLIYLFKIFKSKYSFTFFKLFLLKKLLCLSCITQYLLKDLDQNNQRGTNDPFPENKQFIRGTNTGYMIWSSLKMKYLVCWNLLKM